MNAFAALFAAALLTSAAPAAAQLVIDCPLRDAPHSTAMPAFGIMSSPAALAEVNRIAPEFVQRVPEFFRRSQAPTFSAILTFEMMAVIAKIPADTMAELNLAFAALPVTDAEKAARCDRYDNVRNDLPVLPQGKPRLLLFEKMSGFRDDPSVDAAHAAFLELMREQDWTIVATDKGGAITNKTLSKFDAVIWNNVSGDVLTLTQRAALRRFVERGGGFVAVHGSSGDPAYFWKWYREDLIGAHFIGHTLVEQFQAARVVIDDPAHPLAAGLPPEWTMKNEWYSFAASPRDSGAHVLATLDEASYSPVGGAGQDLRIGDHPVAWTRCVGKGRSFYSAIGHLPETYANPIYRTMLISAMRWAAQPASAGCRDESKVDEAQK